MSRLPQLLVFLGLILWPMAIHAQTDELTDAANEAEQLFQSGRLREAIPFVERVIALSERAHGTDDQRITDWLNVLGYLYRNDGQYPAAEPLYRRVLAAREKALGPEHPDVARSLNNLAVVYSAQGRYDEAEPLYERALAINEATFGANHQLVAASLNNLASVYDSEGRFAEAEPLYKRSIAITERVLGPEHPELASSLNNLALLYVSLGRHAEAESLLKRAVTIRENALGSNHPDVAASLSSLATLYEDQGRYGEAEPLYKRSLMIVEKSLGPDHPDVASNLSNLAKFYWTLGRYAEAEPLNKRALAIFENALGLEHRRVAISLNNLAAVYQDLGLYGEAEPLYKRALQIWEKALGPAHADVAAGLNNLGAFYFMQARYAEAESFYKRALEIRKIALGSDHPDVAESYNNLAELYRIKGKYAEAETENKRALTIRQDIFGYGHPEVAMSMQNLALLYQSQGRYSEAERLNKQALLTLETALGSDHPRVSVIQGNLAFLYEEQGRYAEAIGPIRRASSIIRDRPTRKGADQQRTRETRAIFLRHADIAYGLSERVPSRRLALLAEGFEAGQLAQATSAAAAISRMAARFGAGDDALAHMVRAQQDVTERWRRLDKALVASLSQTPDKRDSTQEKLLRRRLSDLDHQIGALDAQLAHDFPKYDELVTTRSLPLRDVQEFLNKDEALIAYSVGMDHTLLWVILSDDAQVIRLNILDVFIDEYVQTLRSLLDPHANLRPVGLRLPGWAHEIYKDLFEPTEALLEGVKHLFIVPDGALDSLPFGILVTEELDDTADLAYRGVPWLARKYAITTLPSVSSLRALRQYAKTSKADEPFLGVGDPVLSGHPTTAPEIELSGLFSLRGIGHVEAVRSLSSLPETAVELEALADNLTASPGSVLLREEATEPNLRSIDLERYRVLAFATHAVVAGELKGLAEPALVLTPPDVATDENDGLLTASEVATLKLDADWVILSACNTAAPDGTPGAEALSGLAKAFFYAGSRALLVSHWPVDSEAAVLLTTRMLAEYAKEPDIGRAEALRRSMMALMDDQNYAHPFYWAPFVIVGEGGRVAN